MTLQIDRDYLHRTLQHLVQINSVNPTLAPGAPGEVEIASYVAENLHHSGLHVTVLEKTRGRPSVLATLKGTGGGKSLMLNAHCDTVGVEGMTDPFSGEIRDGRLYGRGAYDMKGSLAACMAAARALAVAKEPPDGDVVVAAVADEEYASIGTTEVLTEVQTDGAIVTEPTGLQIGLAHKGFIWARIETAGKAAHGSQFEIGVDANRRMGPILVELDRLADRLQSREGHPLLGPPSLHAARLHGGTGLSTYADRCRLDIERRTIPGETADKVEQEFQELLEASRAEGSELEADLELFFVRDPFEVSAEAHLVRTLRKTATEILGATPRFVGENPWMDSALTSAAGIETVVYGCSGEGAHASEEWVDLSSVEDLARVLAATAAEYCHL